MLIHISIAFPRIGRDNNPVCRLVEMSEDIVPIKPFCPKRGTSTAAVLMLVKNQGRTELWSYGRHNSGLLGQGEGKTESTKLAPLDYDRTNITFVNVQVFHNFAYAVTDKGKCIDACV